MNEELTFRAYLAENKQGFFLGSLLLVLIGSVFFPPIYQHSIISILVMQNMVFGLLLIQKRFALARAILFVFLGLCSIHVGLTFFGETMSVDHASQFLFGLYFTFISIIHFYELYREKQLSMASIYAVFSGFILLAFAFGFALKFIHTMDPNSINGIGKDAFAADFIYFSFITLMTIGYGDIVPATDIARQVVVFASLVGHFYTVFITAFIIGKLINKQNESAS